MKKSKLLIRIQRKRDAAKLQRFLRDKKMSDLIADNIALEEEKRSLDLELQEIDEGKRVLFEAVMAKLVEYARLPDHVVASLNMYHSTMTPVPPVRST